MKVATVEEMRTMDRRAAEQYALAEEILMENAALASCSVLASETGIRGRRFALLCGAGNNGGDGLAAARLLHSHGAEVKVFLAAAAGKFKGAARRNLDIVHRLPLETQTVASAGDVRKELLHSHVLVDALLGTGLDRPVSGLYADLIDLMNGSGKKILSLDIPSGINGDTGESMGAAVRADYTCSFGLPKIGNMLYPGYGHCGKLYVSHISFPPSLYNDAALKIRTNDQVMLPERPAEAHKGSMGKALIIAGSAGYLGAPYFSAMSFLKAGGGYAYLAAPRSIVPVIAQRGGEIVFVPQGETASGGISANNKAALLELAEKTDMVVIGPGLSLDRETQALVRELTPLIDKPLLIDGDGISALAGQEKLIRRRKAPTVLTPHMGEMARLSGQDVPAGGGGKIAMLQEWAGKLQALLVIKGAHSLIGEPGGQVFINLSGNAGMATAGAGDVLNGVIAAMFGLGLPATEAVRKGVFLHGLAGDLAAADRGRDGITASDILEYLPAAMKNDREKGKTGAAGRYEPFLI